MHGIYISPGNMLNNAKFRSTLLTAKYKNNLVALVVDESHCVKTWSFKDYDTYYCVFHSL